MRGAELARLAGLSVQQVRNYVDLGFLPPVERSANGYRVFTARHADALAVARQVIAGHGWAPAREIMRAVHAGDRAAALAVVDRRHADLDREREQVRRVLGAFDTVVAASVPDQAARRELRVGEVARTVGVRAATLRSWERRGLLRPGRQAATGYRAYDGRELRLAHIVALLRRGGYRMNTIAAVLAQMRSSQASLPERVRAELARREEELQRRSWERLRASAILFAYMERV